jgi:hypothetical protein
MSEMRFIVANEYAIVVRDNFTLPFGGGYIMPPDIADAFVAACAKMDVVVNEASDALDDFMLAATKAEVEELNTIARKKKKKKTPRPPAPPYQEIERGF